MAHPSHRFLLCIAAAGLVSASVHPAHAGHPATPFGVEFTDCVESIGVGLVPTPNVLALTPPGFIPVGINDPVSPIVVRTSDCAGIAVDGGKPRPGSVVQIGAVIVPPAPSGELIDNYTFWYYTSDTKLAKRLQDLGVSAQHVEPIRYDLDPGEIGTANSIEVSVPRPGSPRFVVSGTVFPSDTPSGSFRAAWWQQTAAGNVRMDTNVPMIAISSADTVLTTGAGNALTALIGGTMLEFPPPLPQQFNLFTRAHMDVTVP